MSTLLRQLNNTIIQWENIYGDFYTSLYDEDGNIKLDMRDCDYLFNSLKQAESVLRVLNRLKRNRNYNLKKLTKRQYNINY